MHSRARAFAGVVIAGLVLAGCEAPANMRTKQTGYRGTAMDQVRNPNLVDASSAYVPPPPYELEPDTGGERASQVYENVQVLGDLSSDEFNRLMISITEWVSPEGKVPNGGCNYCHNPENMASDAVYTKVVARKMLQMTRNINQNWQSHVQKVGVTCWTCHRGNPVPLNKWSVADVAAPMGQQVIRGNKHGQNTPNPMVAYASLPYDPFSKLLQGQNEVRVASPSAYPSPDHQVSIKQAETTYGLMMHFASSLGVNCTYCHNSSSFKNYNLANPQKAQAWYAIRMVRQTNDEYINALKPVFPANRLGPHGDPYKSNCATCHQGLAKPMNGVSMLKDHPALAGPRAPYVASAVPAAASAAAPVEASNKGVVMPTTAGPDKTAMATNGARRAG